MFPILLNLANRHVCVIGGGAVGARKATALLAAEAIVRVIDPRAPLALPSEVVHVPESYRAEHLDGAVLVFACATPDMNAQVVADAHARGVWVNTASAPDDGDFALPAVVRRGDLVLAVSTGGAAPALARRIREKLETEFDEAFGAWVQVLADMRKEVLATIPEETRRRSLLDAFAEWEWLARVRTEGPDAVRTAMRAML